MATDYPTTLPVPQTETVTPFERAQLSNSDRPREARALSTDRLAVVRATWPPLSPADAAIFEEWWRVQIYQGGAWFNATWPLPQGLVGSVFRFIQQPRWRFVPGGRWRIEGVLEQRGRGLTVIDGPRFGVPSNPWNTSNEVGSVTFSDADFVATVFPEQGGLCVSSDSAEGILGNGLYYAELRLTISEADVGTPSVAIGVTRDNPGGSSVGASLSLTGTVNVNGADVDSTSGISSGDVVMIALDAFEGQIYFGINGTWLDSSNPSSAAGGYALGEVVADYWLFFGYEGDGFAAYSCELRTGTDRFDFAVPSGYTAWVAQGE